MLAEFLLNRVKRQAEPLVGFDPKQCLRSRLNTNTCDRCLTLCTRGALTLDGRKILFTAERCTGCMACVSGCPNDALVSGFDLLSLPTVLRNSTGTEAVVLTCGRTRRFAGQITVPCLGLLSAEPVLAALNAIASQEIYLDVSRCADCDNHHILDLLHEGLQALLKKTGTASRLGIRCLSGETMLETDPGRQRRSLLRLVGSSIRKFGGDVSSSFAPALAPAAQNNGEGKKGGARISCLLQQAFSLLPDDAVQDKEVLLSYQYTLEIGENCNLCPSCTGMCPTGALKRRTDGSGKQLVFTSALCSGCGLCVAFCRKKALTLRPGAGISPGAMSAIT